MKNHYINLQNKRKSNSELEQPLSSRLASSNDQKFTILNHKYEMIQLLGKGKTSKVYLCRDLKDPSSQVAVKLASEQFLNSCTSATQIIDQEINVLEQVQNHPNIVQIQDFGYDGHIKQPNGEVLREMIYIVLEYASGGCLYDLSKKLGPMGEEGGRYFMDQFANVIAHMHQMDLVHLDLKPENIMLDEYLNIKVADFGAAINESINQIKQYKGSRTYMAPEILEHKIYNGKQADIFSAGVILFVMVQGSFPFNNAKRSDRYYKLIMNGKYDEYWQEIGGERLSPDFQDLFISMVQYDGNKRPTIEQILNHPWMLKYQDNQVAKLSIIQKTHGYKVQFQQGTNPTKLTQSYQFEENIQNFRQRDTPIHQSVKMSVKEFDQLNNELYKMI